MAVQPCTSNMCKRACSSSAILPPQLSFAPLQPSGRDVAAACAAGRRRKGISCPANSVVGLLEISTEQTGYRNHREFCTARARSKHLPSKRKRNALNLAANGKLQSASYCDRKRDTSKPGQSGNGYPLAKEDRRKKERSRMMLYRRGEVWWFKFRFSWAGLPRISEDEERSLWRGRQSGNGTRAWKRGYSRHQEARRPPYIRTAAADWLKLKKPTLAAKSYRIEELNIDKHLKPIFGSLLLIDITADDIADSRRIGYAKARRQDDQPGTRNPTSDPTQPSDVGRPSAGRQNADRERRRREGADRQRRRQPSGGVRQVPLEGPRYRLLRWR